MMAETFSKAFAAARKRLGAGKTFTWNGKSYSTDRADDKPRAGKKKAAGKSTAPESSIRPSPSPRDKDKPAEASPRAKGRPNLAADARGGGPETRLRAKYKAVLGTLGDPKVKASTTDILTKIKPSTAAAKVNARKKQRDADAAARNKR